MNFFLLIILLAAWVALATLLVMLWRKWGFNKTLRGASEKERAMRKITKARDEIGMKDAPGVERLRASAGDDPKKLAEIIKAWIGENDGDKLSK